MKKSKIHYFIITILFLAISLIILSKINVTNNIQLSIGIEMILILYLIRISYGCSLYIKKQYQEHKYSYSIIMNLGLLIFININILRLIFLLIDNWDELNIIDIYTNTLKSFSYFVMLVLPVIIVLSIYSIISNIVLIKKESFNYRNMLGIFLGFLALLGLFGSQAIYIFTTHLKLNSSMLILKNFIDISINITLSYFYTLIIATLYCNIKAAKHEPKYNKDFIIILGSMIKKDGTLTPLLKGRVDRAIEFGEKQYQETKRKIIYIPSGGKGSDEIIAEAQAIKNYLIEKGVPKEQIIIEDKSTSTIENIQFSKKIINKINKKGSIIFSTTNYHVFRSGIIANKCGIDCEGIGSKTKWYFYSNALIREFIANLFQEKKSHIILLLLINITLFILVLVGYYCNFYYIY